MVSSKSEFASPGNPTIKSEDRLILGRVATIFRIIDLYSKAVCPRFIAAKIRSLPHSEQANEGEKLIQEPLYRR